MALWPENLLWGTKREGFHVSERQLRAEARSLMRNGKVWWARQACSPFVDKPHEGWVVSTDLERGAVERVPNKDSLSMVPLLLLLPAHGPPVSLSPYSPSCLFGTPTLPIIQWV